MTTRDASAGATQPAPLPTDAGRIVHVPRRFTRQSWGGTESVVLNLCRQQRARGGLPEIHTSKALDALASETCDGVPVRRHAYFYPRFPLRAETRAAYDRKGGNLVSFALFRALLRLRDVRVFHAHALKRLGGEVLTAARRRGRPCVVTVHGNYFDVPADEQAAMRGGGFGIEWGKILGGLFRSRSLLDEADAVCCVGHSEFEAARARLPHDRIYYLPNGVNVEPFENADRREWRARLGFGDDDFIFGCVSRIDPQKGQARLLAALGELLHAHPRAAAVLAGPVTDPAYGSEVEQRALAMRGRVRLLPAVVAESPEHAGLLAAIDAFVLPSRHEPFGIVVLEAWAARKPVLASRLGGLLRLIDDGVDGLHCEPGDTADLVRRMALLLTSPDLCERLASAGAAKARAEFTWSRVALRMEEIYRRAEAHRATFERPAPFATTADRG